MDKNFLVSIIIATYNRANLIEETINSVVNQTYTNWECIIVDDASTDNTEEVVGKIIKNDERIKFYSRPYFMLKGPNSSRNFGISKSNGDYILSLDSDDWLLENHLKEKIEIFKRYKNIEGVLSKTIMVDDDRKEIKRENRTKLSNNLLEDFVTLKISWYMHDIMWKKKFLENKTLYNEKLLKWLDRDFHIRRIAENPNMYLIDEFLSLYRIHSNSNSSNTNYRVLETRHYAILEILEILKKKKLLSNTIKLFFFKFQVQNLVVLYKSPKVLNLYYSIIKMTFLFKIEYFIWIFKLIAGYFSYKIFNKGLKIIK